MHARATKRKVRSRWPSEKKNLPVIYLPGILGVKLFDRRHHAYVWGDYRGLLFRDEQHAGYALGHDDEILANEPLHHFRIVPGLVSTHVTTGLVRTLESALGYRVGRDLFFVGHDWRKDYRLVAQRVEMEIRRVQWDFGKRTPIIVIGQSMSNLAIRYLLRTCTPEIRDSVAKWYAFGPPWQGTFNALTMLRKGYYPATTRFHGFSPSDAATYDSCYQLLPREAQLLDASGRNVSGFDIYDVACWIDYGLGSPDLARHRPAERQSLQVRLDGAKQFGDAISGTDPREERVPQTWFAGNRNWAVRAAIADAGGAVVTGRAIRQRHPTLAPLALARGDDHIPLSHLTDNACGPLVRSYDGIPYGESYVLVGQPRDHRALINYPPNLRALAMDIAAVRSQQ